MDFTATLLAALKPEWVADDIADYLDRFAGRHFEVVDGGGDRLGVCDEFTAADVTAIGTLSVSLGPEAIDKLLFSDVKQRATALLAQIPVEATIYGADAVRLHEGPGTELWELIASLPDVARTKTSKLLARKRPHLFPIVDTVVFEALGKPQAFWKPMREAFAEEVIQRRIHQLRSKAGVPPTISDLRVADIGLWMRYRIGGSEESRL